MGVPKRKAPGGQDGTASPAGAAKRARTEERLSLLTFEHNSFSALEAFVSAAKKLPREDVYDVVEGYIKISVECAEIFQLLSGEKRPESEMLLIFQAFEAILLRTAGDLSHFHVVGTNIVKKLMNNHMKLIYESLYASGYRMARACLNLMAAMVTQGPEAARDVCSHFDLNKKTLYTLVTKRDSKGVHDVRLAYIQFALSFLIAGDDSTIVQVLELKEFIPCIFSSGIKEDRISTVNILLSTLETKVVHNKNITKTQKVRFFTGQLLNHIASLYSWNGIVDASTEDAGKTMVRELVHSFLMDLCCSLKHGINFYDASLGTFGRGGNLTLLHFLLGLKTAADDELVAELVVNILKVCPDLLNKYFKEVTFSFLPRVKSTWSNNIKLLNKIYEAQPDISRAFQTREFIPLPRLLAMVMVTTVPLVCNKIMFTQALNLDSKSVRHTAFSLLAVILKRALKTIDYCLNKEVWQESGVYTAAMMEEFVRLFREALSKILPDLNTIVWVWQSLRKQDAKQDDEKGKQRGDRTPAACVAPECGEGSRFCFRSDDAETILLKAVLLQVICLYQKVVPHVVMQYNFDFSKLLKGIISEQGLREEAPPVLQHHMLRVALELPASKFLWLKAQEGPDAEIIGGERSVFYLLMKMFVTSSHVQLKSSTKLLIVKILQDFFLFEHTWRELELWLDTLQATVTKQDADDVSIPVSHIDDVLDMVDVLVEGSEGLDEEIGFLLNEDMILLTFPFSAVVPAALEARNKLLLGTESEAGTCVFIVTYLTGVLTDLLHTQRDPLALCLLLQAYDKLEPPLPPCCRQLSWFSRYYSLWIPEPAREALVSCGRRCSRGSQAFPGKARRVLPGVWLSSSQLGGSTGPPRLQLLLDLLRSLVVHCEQLDAQNQQRCEAAQAESDLFLDMESMALLELANDKTLEEVLVAILRHPTLEGWYLALEQQALPPHTLSPILVKLLAGHLSAGVLQLLMVSAPILRNTGQLGLLARYSEAITQSVLKELRIRRAGPATSPPKTLPQLEALQGLHPYMEDAQLREVILALLTLPEAHLVAHQPMKSPRKERRLNILGNTLVQLLTSGRQDQLLSGELLWASEYVKGLGALLPTLAVDELDAVFLHTLQREPVLAPVVGVHLLDYCLARRTQASLSIAALLLEQSCTHLLRFELWCWQAGMEHCLREGLDDFLPLVHVYLQCRTQGHFTRPAGGRGKCDFGWIVADSVTAALKGSAEELHTWKKTLLESCVKWLIMSFTGSQQANDNAQDQEKQMLLRLNELLVGVFSFLFFFLPPRFRYQDHTFLKALHAAIQLLYLPESSVGTKLFFFRMVHMMLTQHSLFLPTLLRKVSTRLKCFHFHPGDSRSALPSGLRVFFWGPAAVEHHKTCRSLGKSLWQQPSVGDILRLLDQDRMMKTILHFPQNRRLLPPKEPVFKDRSTVELDGLYDPCFLLHLFSELTRPEFVVDCRKFLDSNALGLTVAALSSYDPQMRAAAYSVLAAYYSHVEGARFREQSQLLYLLDVVRNGIRTQNMRLTFTLTLFIAKAALQILKPEEHMYLKINKFLLSHEYLNMSKVPGFFQFFFSSDFEQKTEQEWLFGILRQGIRDKYCYELCARRGVFHIILSFFSSPLCDEVAQNWILEILQNAARDAKSAYEFLRDYSLLTWILHILESKFLETQLLSNIISLLHTLWVTNLGDKGVERESQPPCKAGPQEPPKLLALQLEEAFVHSVTLAPHRPALASAQLTSFFEALGSVLRYRATVLQAFKDMNRFTVNETVLSTRDVLILMHKWSLIERDVQLQEALRAAVEKYQVKELLKMLKDKNKPVTPARAKGPRGWKKRLGEAEEAADPELDMSSLETCKGLLRSILTHWGPVFPNPEAAQEPEDRPTPQSDAPDPVHATASLVVSWVLRSVAEHPLSRTEASRLLGWLKSHILPQPVVVADLLKDSAVRSGIFKLYSRLCSAERLAGPEQQVACLFNTVMLQLVAARGPAGSPFHPAVATLCLSSLSEEDEATRGNAAFLVSLYVKDVWLGAQQPDTLLAHVRMISDASEGAPGGNEDAIVMLCKDIAAAAPDS
uniref:URB1 ribosome biogenesis homolog n=1 Tax=Equus asinus asinus TaxID=83772 RepID=A0A8C4PJU8_EQUAS